MTSDDVRLLPSVPAPRAASPYFDATARAVTRPDGVGERVWNSARPAIEQLIDERLDGWTPRTPTEPAANPAPAPPDYAEMRRAMTGALLRVLVARLTDEARAAGTVEALVANARDLLDEETLQQAFDAAWRRFCVGPVRARTRDMLAVALGSGASWRVVDGPAEILARADAAPGSREVRYQFDEARGLFVLEFVPDASPDSDPDRLFVALRGDATWARVDFEVLHAGRRWRAEAPVFLHEHDWFEQELRLAGASRDPLEPRLYRVLRDAGPEARGEPLVVRLIVTRSTPVGAWTAKLARAYRQAFREVPFARYLATSFSLALLCIVFTILSCTLAGYAFARLEWPGRGLCFALLLGTMMLPPQVTMVPQFILVRWIGWYDTLLPLWVPALFGGPFFIFLVRQFLRNIPLDLEDAARIDGCGFLRIYWHVMLPLIRPVIATIAIFTFLWTWNNFIGPLIYLNDERLFPLALGLFRFNLRSGGDVTLMMAGAVLMTLPVLALFALLQRQFVQGVTLTGTTA
jgi:multiple sugar transport system permease protein